MTRTIEKKVTVTAILVFAAVMTLLFLSTIATGTGINVSVPTQNYRAGDTINATIMCTPTTWIKAWEMKVVFNKNKLQATSVIEGSFFKPGQTFFNAGTINNTAGTIKDLYDLILGIGNASATKPLFYIMFTARNYGQTFINLSNVGITNETKYLGNLFVSNTTFYVYSQYDLNYDKTVGLPDLILVAGKYGQIGAPGWIKEDIDKNGKIDLMDIVQVAWHWGAY